MGKAIEGELVLAGEFTLNECEAGITSELTSMSKSRWTIGMWLSRGRALCELPDCGIEGKNPDHRFGNWVSANFADIKSRTALDYRNVHECFGDKRDKLEKVNAAIAAGDVATHDGERVAEPLAEALVTDDGKRLYPVNDGIPVLLEGESITLEQIV